VRRQTNVGDIPADAGRELRLDPLELPVRYSANLAGAAQDVPVAIMLDRDKAVLRHRLAGGLAATTTVPIAAYSGVAVRMVANDAAGIILATIELMHGDPALSLPLVVAERIDEIAADWQAWGQILGLPLLLVEADGSITRPTPEVGRIMTAGPQPRRRSGLGAKRRPRFLTRRKTGRMADTERLTGREIIARN
jgi:hypothetical protein